MCDSQRNATANDASNAQEKDTISANVRVTHCKESRKEEENKQREFFISSRLAQEYLMKHVDEEMISKWWMVDRGSFERALIGRKGVHSKSAEGSAAVASG